MVTVVFFLFVFWGGGGVCLFVSFVSLQITAFARLLTVLAHESLLLLSLRGRELWRSRSAHVSWTFASFPITNPRALATLLPCNKWSPRPITRLPPGAVWLFLSITSLGFLPPVLYPVLLFLLCDSALWSVL